MKYVFSSKNAGIGEIRKRALALSFQTRNSFESIKILIMAKRAFGVDLKIIFTFMIRICFRELK
jgi:hypothetical protein